MKLKRKNSIVLDIPAESLGKILHLVEQKEDAVCVLECARSNVRRAEKHGYELEAMNCMSLARTAERLATIAHNNLWNALDEMFPEHAGKRRALKNRKELLVEKVPA